MNKNYVNYEDQVNQLKELKEFAKYFKTTPAQCLQQALKDVDMAYDRFTKKISHYPKYHKYGKNESYRYPQPK